MSDKLSLLKMIDELQKRGVKTFKGAIDGSEVTLEFGPQAEKLSATGQTESTPDPELCKCGHMPYQHVNAMCALGCLVELCAGPEDSNANNADSQ